MKKILFKDIDKELKKAGISSDCNKIANMTSFGVYHYHEWDHGYETYYGYNGTRREFYSDMKEMTDFLYSYSECRKLTELIVTPWYNYNQFAVNAKYYDNCTDIYEEICDFLKRNSIRRNSRTGIELSINSNKKDLEMIIEGAFRGITTLCIFFRQNAVMLEPTHHFGFNFWVSNYMEEIEFVKQLLKSYPNLQIFEKK